jgi:hypothetical protein
MDRQGCALLNADFFRHLALTVRFACAMFHKLRLSEAKYHWAGQWRRTLTQQQNAQRLAEHSNKGDPRDVAIFAAFAWYHKWSTSKWRSQGEYRLQLDTAPVPRTPLNEATEEVLREWKLVHGYNCSCTLCERTEELL